MVESNVLEKELKKIIGMPLRSAGRACDLIWFGFGNLVQVPDRRNNGYREVAEFALHVQCSWRIIDSKKIIVGSADKYIPNSLTENWDEFDWDIQGANRCDEQIKNLIDLFSSKLIVINVTVDNLGGIKIYFMDNILLEVMLDSSTDDEVWRFFQSAGDSKHLVMTGTGVDL